MREHSLTVIEHLEAAVKEKARIVISAITYAEMRYGATASKAPKKLDGIVKSFVKRLDARLFSKNGFWIPPRTHLINRPKPDL